MKYCPNCEKKVKGKKHFNIIWAIIFFPIYFIYYFIFKKKNCEICDTQLR